MLDGLDGGDAVVLLLVVLPLVVVLIAAYFAVRLLVWLLVLAYRAVLAATAEQRAYAVARRDVNGMFDSFDRQLRSIGR